jgi:tetratricopeptide (TPR) repeat protein
MRLPLRLLMILAATATLLAANSSRPVASENTLNQANLAALRGEFSLADALYDQAANTTTDPGLVAFNKAYCATQQQLYRQADALYLQVLDDTEAPPTRLASAHYNRAVCLIRIGGLTEYRLAIDHLERCLGFDISEELRGDARQNLEVAKLLWISAREREKQKPKPNDPAKSDPPPTQSKEDPPAPPEQKPNQDNGTSSTQQKGIGTNTQGTGQATDKTQGGAGTLPVKFSGAELPPWTDAELTEYLQQLSKRVAKERRATEALVAPAPRPNVKDW